MPNTTLRDAGAGGVGAIAVWLVPVERAAAGSRVGAHVQRRAAHSGRLRVDWFRSRPPLRRRLVVVGTPLVFFQSSSRSAAPKIKIGCPLDYRLAIQRRADERCVAAAAEQLDRLAHAVAYRLRCAGRCRHRQLSSLPKVCTSLSSVVCRLVRFDRLSDCCATT